MTTVLWAYLRRAVLCNRGQEKKPARGEYSNLDNHSQLRTVSECSESVQAVQAVQVSVHVVASF